MKISEVPEKYKIYDIHLSNKDTFSITGEQKIALLKSKNSFVELQDGAIINKNFIVDMMLNIDETRDSVIKHKPKILLDIVS